MVRSTGVVLLIVGAVAALVGSLWNLLLPTPDANIGAGMPVVIGLPVAGVGLLLLVASLVLGRMRKN